MKDRLEIAKNEVEKFVGSKIVHANIIVDEWVPKEEHMADHLKTIEKEDGTKVMIFVCPFPARADRWYAMVSDKEGSTLFSLETISNIQRRAAL